MIDNFEELIVNIKNQLPIKDFIGRYTKLIKHGTYWKGRCTFCGKDNSLSVSDVFYCFNCHIGGDIFTFVAKQHRMTLKEAVFFLSCMISNERKAECEPYDDCDCCKICGGCNCEEK